MVYAVDSPCTTWGAWCPEPNVVQGKTPPTYLMCITFTYSSFRMDSSTWVEQTISVAATLNTEMVRLFLHDTDGHSHWHSTKHSDHEMMRSGVSAT
jgi:hypothetical protein